MGAAKRSVSSTGLSRKKENSLPSVQNVKNEHSLRAPTSEPGRSRAAHPQTTKIVQPAPERASSTARNFRSLLNHASSRPASPAPSQTPTGSATSTASTNGVVPAGPAEASLVSKVALRLSELVNHAFPTDKGVVWNGRAATKPDVTQQIGHVILS